MKLLILILLPFFSFAQGTTYEPGDSTWIVSSDTGKVKVYKYFVGHGETCLAGSIRWIDSLKAHGIPMHLTNQGSVRYDVDNPLKSIEAPIRCLFIPDKKIITDTADPSFIDSKTTRWREKQKYDTLPPVWKQVSDTTPGYNPVMAMRLYEVRQRIIFLSMVGPDKIVMAHFAWLDIHKKPFKLFVWKDKTLEP